MEFDVPPGVFDRIELRRVRRQLEKLDFWIFLDPSTHFLTPMSTEAVPNHQDVLAGIVQLQLLQESDTLNGADILPG